MLSLVDHEVNRTGHAAGACPRFAFASPPVRHSLPMALAFAATADRPTAVLTGPGVVAGGQPGLIRLPRAMVNRHGPGRSGTSPADGPAAGTP